VASDRRPTPRLDEATNLDRGHYSVIIRPACGEAVITRPTRRGEPTGRLPDPERSRAEAARRAATAVRRLVCEHKLTRMWTLTLAEQTYDHQRPEVVRRVQGFTRRLRRSYPRLVWLAVLEWHPGGHGWHVHMVVDRYVPKDTIRRLWGWGHVDARRITVKGDSTTLQATRKAASYVAKYVTKDQGEGAPPHEPGDHRYLRPLGLTWTELRGEGEFSDLVRMVWGYWRTAPAWCWWSGTDESWRGPSCLVLRV